MPNKQIIEYDEDATPDRDTSVFLKQDTTGGIYNTVTITKILAALLASDIPDLSTDKLTSGTLDLDRGGTGVDLSSSGDTNHFLAQDDSHIISARALTTTDIPNLSTDKLTSGTLPLDRGGTGVDLSSSGAATHVLTQDASHVISARALVAADIPNLSASKITSGTLPIGRGGTNATTEAAARSSLDVVQKGTSGIDEAVVSEVYDSAGSGVVLDIDAAGDTSFTGDVSSDGDMFPLNFGRGIATRFVDIITTTPTTHFRSGALPGGYTWATTGAPYGGGSFSSPTGIAVYDLDYLGDYLKLYTGNTDNGQYFLQTAETSSGVYELFFRAICFSANDVFCGVRLDNNTTDNQFIEWGLYWDSTNSLQKWQLRYDIGGGQTLETSATGTLFPEMRMLSLRHLTTGHQQLIYPEIPQQIVISSIGGDRDWERCGLIIDHRNNFVYSYFDWYHKD